MKTKSQKSKIVEGLVEKINTYPVMIFSEYHGLKVTDINELKKQFPAAGNNLETKFEVVKNNLFELALKKTKYSSLADSLPLKGPLAVLWTAEVAAASKLLVNYAKDHQNLKLQFGISDDKMLGSQDLVVISKLPSKEVLISKLLGVIKAPVANLVSVINAPTQNVVLILNQKAKQQKEN